MPKGQFLELNDVAHLLNCSPRDVMAMVHDGKLTAVKKGPYLMFRIPEVRALKEKLRASSPHSTKGAPRQ